MAIICSTIFILISFGVSYYLWGSNGLPLGWDTPHYVEQANILASQGFGALMATQGPYDFTYQLLTGLIATLGVPTLTVDIYAPIILAALLPYLISRFILVNSNVRFAIFATIATPGWYALYTLGGGLYANLLGLVLMLAATPLMMRSESLRQPLTVTGLVLIGAASFAHIETTLFFTGLLVIMSFIFRTFPQRIASLAAVTVLPATIIYILHFVSIISLAGYNLPVTNAEPIGFWLEIFGTLLPLAAFGFVSILKSKRSSVETFTLIWALASLLIGLSQYINIQTITFAVRAADIIPAPILAAIGLGKLDSLIGRIEKWKPSSLPIQKGVLVGSLLLILVSWPTSYWTSASSNQRVFLSSPAFQKLQWIANNMKFTETPIFVYSDFDQIAGGVGDLYDNWVGAIVGNHLSYIGRVDYLVQLQPTPASNIITRLHSAIFAKQVQDAGVTNRTLLFRHPIVVVADFYNPNPLPTYYAPYFNQPFPGIFVANNTKLASLDNMTFPLATAAADLTGPWYINSSLWADSRLTLYASVTSHPTALEASFPIVTLSNGTYTLSFRYFDGTGNSMQVSLDGNTLGTITYNSTNLPVLKSFSPIEISQGQHLFNVQIAQNPTLLQFAALDYLSLSKS